MTSEVPEANQAWLKNTGKIRQEGNTGLAVAISGNVGNLNIGTRESAARSRYRALVQQRHCPKEILDRDEEIAELVDFCESESEVSYFWWQAGHWAGKTHLMASFALQDHPGLRKVSFFVVGRYADQSDRSAFIAVVIEQLAEILSMPFPQLRPETRDADLLGLLNEAAATCRQRGETLVLAVDGLDEDRGVTADSGVQSIAALLPDPVPPGMKVILASRPNPGIPDDVPPEHPLRNNVIVRTLSSSVHAQVVKQAMEEELKRLLRGSSEEKDLLGFIACANDGLSIPELAELIGCPKFVVRDHLNAVKGRTFSDAIDRFERDPVSRYALGHQALQTTAFDFLDSEVSTYRRRIHEWAEKYSCQAWPETTPAYLLRGYASLLKTTGDAGRMVLCATDKARHERMLYATGGDGLALKEIVNAQNLILKQEMPDLLSMALLSVRRAELVWRNDRIPSEIPEIWMDLGNFARAEMSAISSPTCQIRILRGLAREVAVTGDIERAVSLVSSIVDVDERARELVALTRVVLESSHGESVSWVASCALQCVESLTTVHVKAKCMAELALVWSEVGELDTAIDLARDSLDVARSIGRDFSVWVMRGLARKVVVTGDIERAVSLVSSIVDVDERARELVALTRVVLESSHGESVSWVASCALQCVESLTTVHVKAKCMAELALVWSEVGELDTAIDLARDSLDLARSIESDWRRADTIVDLSHLIPSALNGAIEADLNREAVGVTLAIRDLQTRAMSMGRLAKSAANIGDIDRAKEHAKSIAGFYEGVNSDERDLISQELRNLAKCLKEHGHLVSAEYVARLIRSKDDLASALVMLVEEFGDKGELDYALNLSDEAQSLLGSSTGRKCYNIRFHLAEHLSSMGQLSKAYALAEDIADPWWRERALGAVARAFATAGDVDRALEIASSLVGSQARSDAFISVVEVVATKDLDKAETIVDSIDGGYPQARALSIVARNALHADDRSRAFALAERAEKTSRSFEMQSRSLGELIVLAQILATSGEVVRSFRLLHRIEAIVRSIPEANHRERTLGELGGTFATAGDVDRALEIASSLVGSQARSDAFISVVEVVATKDLDKAETIVDSIDGGYPQARALSIVARNAFHAGDRIRAADLAERAENLTRSLDCPNSQLKIYLSLVETLSRVGWIDRAGSISVLMLYSHDDVRGLGSLIETLVYEGYREVAIDISERASNELLRWMIKRPGKGKSRDIERVMALVDIVAGRLEAGESAAMSIAGPEMTDILLELAQVEFAMGWIDAAKDLAKKAESFSRELEGIDKVGQARFKVELTRFAVASGLMDWAEDLAKSISVPEAKAEALTELAKSVPQQRGSGLLAQAFHVGEDWTIPLTVLGRLQPGALAGLADDLT